ncbi:MAG: hypothetical protein ACLQVJ_00565 [Syntrophobacteraceae bacterium]
MDEFKTCTYMDGIYKSGEELCCKADRCVVCRDGDLEEEPAA